MTADELLEEHRAGLDEWRHDSVAALMRWATTIGVEPQEMLTNPAAGIAPAERMLGDEDIEALSDDDRGWVISHLLAHVAAILMHEHGGGWEVDADPSSPTYTNYVVDAGGTYYDPIRATIGYLKSPPGERDLAEQLAETVANPTGPATKPNP